MCLLKQNVTVWTELCADSVSSTIAHLLYYWVIFLGPGSQGYTPLTTQSVSPSLLLHWFSGRSRELRCVSTQTRTTGSPGNVPGNYGRSSLFMSRNIQNTHTSNDAQHLSTKAYWRKAILCYYMMIQTLMLMSVGRTHNLYIQNRKLYHSLVMKNIAKLPEVTQTRRSSDYLLRLCFINSSGLDKISHLNLVGVCLWTWLDGNIKTRWRVPILSFLSIEAEHHLILVTQLSDWW